MEVDETVIEDASEEVCEYDLVEGVEEVVMVKEES